MVRASLLLTLLFPFALLAQTTDLGSTDTKLVEPFNLTGQHFLSNKVDSNAESRTANGIRITEPTQGGTQSSAKPPKKPATEPPPRIPGSMVGYIDDATIASEIRMRFDAAFNNNASDRAEFFYPQYAGISGPGPNFVVGNLNFQQAYLMGEYAPKNNTRFSFLVEVPFRWIQPQSTLASTNSGPTVPASNTAGLSDVAGGFKLAAVASSKQYLTFQVKAYFPSGNASQGLGTNHYVFEPELLYLVRFSGRLTLEAQVGDSHPIGGSSCQTIISNANYPKALCVAPPADGNPPAPQLSNSYSSFAGDVFFYGVGPSYVVYQGTFVQIAPVIELVGWRVLGGLVTEAEAFNNTNPNAFYQQAISANGINIVSLKAGVRTSIGKRNSFYIGGGYAVTHSRWYQDILRVEYRYSF